MGEELQTERSPILMKTFQLKLKKLSREIKLQAVVEFQRRI